PGGQVRGRGQGAAGRQDIVDDHDAAHTRLHLQYALAVLERVRRADDGRGELSLLADRHETLAVPERERRGEDEAARLDAGDGVDVLPWRQGDERAQRIDDRLEMVAQERRDIAEQDARAGKVRNVADVLFQIHRD